MNRVFSRFNLNLQSRFRRHRPAKANRRNSDHHRPRTRHGNDDTHWDGCTPLS